MSDYSFQEPTYYVLENRTPVAVYDIAEWSKQFGKIDARRVAHSTFDGVEISTVFLGLVHGHTPDQRPLLFETAVFADPHARYKIKKHFAPDCDPNDDTFELMMRTASWEEAELSHQMAVNLIKSVLNISDE